MRRHQIGFVCFLLVSALSVGCKGPGYNLPHPDRLAQPGPGVGGPGPGVLSPDEMMAGPAGAAPASYAGDIQAGGDAVFDAGMVGGMPTVQVLFTKPSGMRVAWDESGSGTFATTPLVAPARSNFQSAGLYRLKITHIPAHPGVELYPTVEIAPPTPRTHAFLAHNTVPVQWTVDDLNQIISGNFVTKVIYLPDPDFQHLAVAGVETLVSTRLDPGIDPIVEADRRGSILAIIRTGNKDIEMPGMEGQATVGYSTFAAESRRRGPKSAVAQASFNETLASSGYAGGGYSGGGFAGGNPVATAMSGGLPSFGAGVGSRGHVTGVNSPSYGYPITGTPIGLPGPPHIPLGAPAGLRKHEIRNWSHNYFPPPSHKVRINVKQSPAQRYPAPRTHAWIHQYNHPNCAHCIGSK